MAVSAAAVSSGTETPRWPRVVGTIGIVVAALTLLDKVGDLLFMLWVSGSSWSSVIGAEAGRVVESVVPPASWIVLTSLVWLGLAVLLLRASTRLRRCRPSAIPLCRAWAWLAICWYAVEMVYNGWWLSRITEQLDSLAPMGWQGYAVLGTVLATVLMLAFPVFLLVWLARPRVRQQWEAWLPGAGAGLPPGG